MVESDTGSDLEGVPVHRGPEVASSAAQLSARAYTTGGEIHLPDEHGPLSAAPARSLLAHELTHVAQQRAMGSTLPPESSTAGARLEAEAEANEHAALQGSTPQRSPLTATTGTATAEAAATARHRPGALPLAPQRAPAPRAGGPTLGVNPGSAAVAAGVAVAGPGGTVNFQPPGAIGGAVAGGNGVQRAVSIDEITTTPTDAPAASGSDAADADDDADVTDEEQDLDTLARRLWPRLQERLRGDLIVARDRAGELVDRF